MDKFLKTLIETAVAPIIALLTEIRDRLPVASQFVPQPASPAAPAQAVPAATPAPPVPASNITRESVGKDLLTYAKGADENMVKAKALIDSYGVEQYSNTGNGKSFISDENLPKFSQALQALISGPVVATKAAAKAAESLI